MEGELLKTIARLDGTPFPATAALVGRWARGRVRRAAAAESTYCAEVVAGTYAAMGLLDDRRPTNYYDPGMFWSGDDMHPRGRRPPGRGDPRRRLTTPGRDRSGLTMQTWRGRCGSRTSARRVPRGLVVCDASARRAPPGRPPTSPPSAGWPPSGSSSWRSRW